MLSWTGILAQPRRPRPKEDFLARCFTKLLFPAQSHSGSTFQVQLCLLAQLHPRSLLNGQQFFQLALYFF